MYIHEAIKARTRKAPFITRIAWREVVSNEACGTAVKIQPTDTPDGCIIENAVTKSLRPGWQPKAEDLMADDWETVSF